MPVHPAILIPLKHQRKQMGSFSIGHWAIVLIAVVLIFGTKKLRSAGSDLGNAVKGFKDGIKSDKKDEAQ